MVQQLCNVFSDRLNDVLLRGHALNSIRVPRVHWCKYKETEKKALIRREGNGRDACTTRGASHLVEALLEGRSEKRDALRGCTHTHVLTVRPPPSRSAGVHRESQPFKYRIWSSGTRLVCISPVPVTRRCGLRKFRLVTPRVFLVSTRAF